MSDKKSNQNKHPTWTLLHSQAKGKAIPVRPFQVQRVLGSWGSQISRYLAHGSGVDQNDRVGIEKMQDRWEVQYLSDHSVAVHNGCAVFGDGRWSLHEHCDSCLLYLLIENVGLAWWCVQHTLHFPVNPVCVILIIVAAKERKNSSDKLLPPYVQDSKPAHVPVIGSLQCNQCMITLCVGHKFVVLEHWDSILRCNFGVKSET